MAVKTDPLQNIVNVSWGSPLLVQVIFTGTGAPAGGAPGADWGLWEASALGKNNLPVFYPAGVGHIWLGALLGSQNIVRNTIESDVWTGPVTLASPPENDRLYSNSVLVNWIISVSKGIKWGVAPFTLPYQLATISAPNYSVNSVNLAGFWGSGLPTGDFDRINNITATAPSYDVPFAGGLSVGTWVNLMLTDFTGGVATIEFKFEAYQYD